MKRNTSVYEAVVCSWHAVQKSGIKKYSGFAHLQPEGTGLGSVYLTSEQFINDLDVVKLGSKILCRIGPRSPGYTAPMALDIEIIN